MCDCISIANKGMAEHGAQLDLATLINKAGVVRRDLQIKTKRLNPKKRTNVPFIVATFCPFCGKEIVRE